MTYIYTHFFSNGDKYVGISNNPEQRWKEGFDSNSSKQYNHKVLIANEKYDRLSLVISENLPRKIAETMEALLITNLGHVFNLNIKNEIMPNLHGNEIICIYNEDFLHVYPQIDGEILYYSPEIDENNFLKYIAVEKNFAEEEMKVGRERREKKKIELRKLKEKKIMEKERRKKELESIGISQKEIREMKERGRKRKKDREDREERDREEREMKGGCYIATSVYGSYDCPEVWTLRRFRDNNLLKTFYGQLFVKIYYAFSPSLLKYSGDKKLFKRIFKNRLDKFVEKLQENGYESTHYIDK